MLSTLATAHSRAADGLPAEMNRVVASSGYAYRNDAAERVRQRYRHLWGEIRSAAIWL